MNRARRVVIVLASVATLAACGPGAGPAPTATARTQATADRAYEVSWSPAPDPIPLNEYFTLQIVVHDEDDAPADLPLAVNADMPGHNHGMLTRPEVTRERPGIFRVDGMLFHMPGLWELYVDLGEEPQRQRVTFPMEIGP